MTLSDTTPLSVAAQLDIYLRANNCPIIGVRIVDMANKATWSCDFADGATLAQKNATYALFATFTPTVTPTDPRSL